MIAISSHFQLINRPSVAGDILQTFINDIKWFIDLVILFLQTIKTSLHPNRKSQGAEISKECSSPTIFCMSCVRCHLSCVRCPVSCFMCQVSGVMCHIFFFFFASPVVELVSGASVINGAYPIYFQPIPALSIHVQLFPAYYSIFKHIPTHSYSYFIFILIILWLFAHP